MNRTELHRILCVEDDPDIQVVAGIALEAGGFEVGFCSSGAEALTEAPVFRPDMILLDVMMPGMDGVTTFLEFRKMDEFKNVPIVFMTAKAQSNELARYEEVGAAGIVMKPFDPMKLTSLIQTFWERRGL